MSHEKKQPLTSDQDFQDQLLYQLCFNQEFLEHRARIFSSKDFVGSTHRELVAKVALAHFRTYHTPVGGLLKTNAAAKSDRLNKDERKALAEYVAALQKLTPAEPRAILDQALEFKKQRMSQDAMGQMLDLMDRGELTGDKLVEIGHSMMTIDMAEESKIVSAADLVVAKIEQPKFVVEGILPIGLTVMAAKKGEGKTTLSFQLGVSVVRKRPFLNRQVARSGRVLMATLEDSPADLQDKLSRIICDLKADKIAGLEILSELPPLPRCIAVLEQHLRAAVRDGKPYVMVCVDPFLTVATPRRGNVDVVRADYAEVHALKKLAKDFGVSLLLNTHSPKFQSADTRDRVLGTNGFTAPADALWVMTRDPNDDMIKRLSISGRSVKDETLKLELTDEAFKLLESGVEVNAGPVGADIVRLLKKNKTAMSPGEIAKALGMNSNNVYQLLHRLHQHGLVCKVADGYQYPDNDSKDRKAGRKSR